MAARQRRLAKERGRRRTALAEADRGAQPPPARAVFTLCDAVFDPWLRCRACCAADTICKRSSTILVFWPDSRCEPRSPVLHRRLVCM